MEVTAAVKPPSRGFSIESLMARDSGMGSPSHGAAPSSSSSSSHPGALSGSPCACTLTPELLSSSAPAIDVTSSSGGLTLCSSLAGEALFSGLKASTGLSGAHAAALQLAARHGLHHPALDTLPHPHSHPHHPAAFHPAGLGPAAYHGLDPHPHHPHPHPHAGLQASLHAAMSPLHRTLGPGFGPSPHHQHMLGGIPKTPFPIYSWLASRPGYLGFSGAEPAFLLPFRKPKRIRTAFSPSQLLRLEHAFEKNHYVVGQERKELAQNLSLTETQVKVWFQNRRTKYKRIKAEEDEEGGVPREEEEEEDEEDGHSGMDSPRSDGAS